MNDWRYKMRMFLTALLMSFGGILPAAGCTGGCGACFQCAGLGGAMAVLAAIGTAREKVQRQKDHLVVEADHGSLSGERTRKRSCAALNDRS